jgi:UDP-glucose 4-epimerase
MAVKNLMTMIAEMIPGGAEIDFSETPAYGHYVMTPYAFNPRLGHKLIANDHVDLGQGLLDCLAELYEEFHRDKQKQNGDWLLPVDKESQS